jgi:hypothetical protein
VKGREEAEEEEEAEAEAAGEGQPLKSRYLSTGPYLARAHCSLLTTTLTTSINQADTATSDCSSWKSSCRPPPVRCTLAQ